MLQENWTRPGVDYNNRGINPLRYSSQPSIPVYLFFFLFNFFHGSLYQPLHSQNSWTRCKFFAYMVFFFVSFQLIKTRIFGAGGSRRVFLDAVSLIVEQISPFSTL